MSYTVKFWLSLMLTALVVLTGVTVWRISQNARARPVGSGGPTKMDSSEPLDLKSFEMTERSGEAFNFEKLKGEVWIANMFFSSCPHQCADLNRAVAALAADPALKDLRFISLTVDPIVDTPEVLKEYAKGFNADDDQWLFMNGDLDELSRFGSAIDVPVGYKLHVRRLILFDRNGKKRGYFRYDDPVDIAELKKMVPTLLAEKQDPAAAESSL